MGDLFKWRPISPAGRRDGSGKPPLAAGSRIVLGAGEGLSVIGNFSLSTGAAEISARFGIPAWESVLANQGSFLAAAVGTLWLAASGWMPRRWQLIAMYVAAGVALGAPILFPAAIGGWFTLYAATAVALYGVTYGVSMYAVRIHSFDRVQEARRGDAVGSTIPWTLITAIVTFAVFGAGWRPGAATLAVGWCALAVAVAFVELPEHRPPDDLRGPASLLQMTREVRPELRGNAVLFVGWGALYFLPPLQGASTTIVAALGTAAQIATAAAITPAGRLADHDSRRAARRGWSCLAAGLLGLSLAEPVVHGIAGWCVAGGFLVVGEFGANVLQVVIERGASLKTEGPRHQALALTGRLGTEAIAGAALAGMAAASSGRPLVFAVICAVCVTGALGVSWIRTDARV